MKYMVATLLLVTLVATASGQNASAQNKPPKNPNVETLLKKMERDWDDVAVTRDVRVLQRILADDWTYWDLESHFKTKSQEIEETRSSKEVCEPIVLDDLFVRVYGTTAVVTGREAGKCRDGQKLDTFHQRFTDVFVKRHGRWQCVATHESPISDDPKGGDES